MSNPGPELFKAMLAFQSTNPGLKKQGRNPHFGSDYFTLEGLTSVARAANEFGLLIYHRQERDEHGPVCVTEIVHAETGQRLSTRVDLLYGRNDSQGMGSAITYCRRYGLMQLFTLCDTRDDKLCISTDDDGEAAMRSGGFREPPPPTLPPKGEREGEHHSSFASDQPRFFAELASQEIDVDYDELCGWLQSIGQPRPSSMTQVLRNELIKSLRYDGRGKQRFLNWKEER